ncbi:Bowman-Birk type proteinase inhibitor C-II-like isoform X2 [Magnolia sinica]|uniref:Bowman-Birk type proteinase inhibitor C-II-like isoform X2 n=1 Tax=Magnolia sinica TaxID=86752 RepID=UPI002658B815|nr:Bowman-Birk type proteinase inhibitor C-II-like isoform X2 [Magnolia sinica]
MGDERQGKKSELQEREKFQRREMGMEKKGLSVMLIVALLATSFLQLHARVDLFTPLTAGVDSDEGGPCCDRCLCNLSNPPQCQCFDVKSYCYPSCKSCLCNWSIPPQCQCFDIKDHCDKPCTATGSVN